MRRCCFRLVAPVHEYLHCEHAKGFSPLWISLWLFRLPAVAVEKLHWLHLCFFLKSAWSLMLRSFVHWTVVFSMFSVSQQGLITTDTIDMVERVSFKKTKVKTFADHPRTALLQLMVEGRGWILSLQTFTFGLSSLRTQCKIKFTYQFQPVNKNMTPRRMISNWFRIAQIDRWTISFTNLNDKLSAKVNRLTREFKLLKIAAK